MSFRPQVLSQALLSSSGRMDTGTKTEDREGDRLPWRPQTFCRTLYQGRGKLAIQPG